MYGRRRSRICRPNNSFRLHVHEGQACPAQSRGLHSGHYIPSFMETTDPHIRSFSKHSRNIYAPPSRTTPPTFCLNPSVRPPARRRRAPSPAAGGAAPVSSSGMPIRAAQFRARSPPRSIFCCLWQAWITDGGAYIRSIAPRSALSIRCDTGGYTASSMNAAPPARAAPPGSAYAPHLRPFPLSILSVCLSSQICEISSSR